jgi:NAD(P)-dependent dehydrogenase (short-subunit alcohol dehydrogenase family)
MTGVLDGKRALITGASRGIGADLARAFAAAGANLVITGRDQATLTERASALADDHGGEITPIAVDLSDPAGVEHLASQALAAYDGLDVLINNAGISYPELVVDLSADHLDEVLQVNLRAPALLAARIGKAMAGAGSGSIINLASTAGVRALSEHYVYCMTKAALIMATKVLALELGPSGVRANAICPTVTLTEMGQRVWLDHPDKAAPMLDRIPLGRFVYPGEVSEVAVWLASDAAAVINGVELPVDGGLLVT